MKLSASVVLLALPALLEPGSAAVRKVSEGGAEISIGFFTGEPLSTGLRFDGTIHLNGGPAVPLTGTVAASGHRATLTAPFRFNDISEELLSHLNPSTFEYTISGHAGSTPVLVSGGGAWNLIAVDAAARNAISRRMTVDDVSLERFSLRRSTVTLRLHLASPLPFDLRLSKLEMSLDSNDRRLGSASRERLLIHHNAVSVVDVPLELDHSSLIAAAGETVMSGGEFSGNISGFFSVKLGGGLASFPFSLPVRISLL